LLLSSLLGLLNQQKVLYPPLRRLERSFSLKLSFDFTIFSKTKWLQFSLKSVAMTTPAMTQLPASHPISG
jgi:hypothetical protein